MKIRAKKTHKIWTAAEDRMLRRRYSFDECSKIAVELGRTKCSVYVRARRFKLAKLAKVREEFVQRLPGAGVLAYTAGLIDGDGSIQLNPNNTGYWGLTICITSCADGYLEGVRSSWFELGTLHYYKSRGTREGRRICNWRIYSAQSAWFLKAILPYMRLKREQALLGIEFRKHVGAHGEPMTEDRQNKRQNLGERMRELNAKTGKGRIHVLRSAI